MTFANPIFLWGFLALLIPIIIHLFNFRKTKRVVFSSTRFLREVKESNQKKRKLKEWLILASRLLFITFIVLAFAQPFQKGEQQDSAGQVLIHIDNSMSMEGEFASGIKKIDQGVKLAQDIVNAYPDTYRFQLYTNSSPSRLSTYKSAEEVLDELSALITDFQIGNPLKFTKDFILESGSDYKEVYVISDFQVNDVTADEFLPADSIRQFNFLAIEGTISSNVFIDSTYLSSPFFIKGQPNSLVVRLRNSGSQDTGEIPVRLVINGDNQGSTSTRISAESSSEVTFPINIDVEESAQVSIIIDDFPNTYDNQFDLVLRGQDRIKIIQLGESGSSSFLASVYGNEALFDFSYYPQSNVDYTLLEEADLIILNEINNLSSPLASNINSFLADGGAVLIIPSETMQLNSFSLLEGFSMIRSSSEPALSQFSQPDRENLLFSDVFTELESNIELPSARAEYMLPSQRNTFITLRNGTPFLVATGELGNLYSFASPLSDDFTNLPRHALFVPLMYKMASLSRQTSNSLYHYTNSSFVSLKVDEAKANDIFTLVNENKEFIPDQRLVGNRLILNLQEGFLRPGFYEVKQGDEIVSVLAFNLPKGESIQQFLNTVQLARVGEFISNLTISETQELNDFEQRLSSRFSGFPLWKYALLIAVFFLVCEILIIRFVK